MVTVYTTTTCSYCNIVKDFLSKNEVEYETKNISIDKNARVELIQKGYISVPITDIHGTIVEGIDLEKMSQLLKLDKKE